MAEYMEQQVQAVNAKAADVYRYMNFDQIAESKEVADTVNGVGANIGARLP